MVIIIESKKARKHLRETGKIYVFRKRIRKKVGKDWMTDKAGGSKIADVYVSKVGYWSGITWRILEPFVKQSGFNSMEEWISDITKYGSGEMPEKGWIYGVHSFGKN